MERQGLSCPAGAPTARHLRAVGRLPQALQHGSVCLVQWVLPRALAGDLIVVEDSAIASYLLHLAANQGQEIAPMIVCTCAGWSHLPNWQAAEH